MGRCGCLFKLSVDRGSLSSYTSAKTWWYPLSMQSSVQCIRRWFTWLHGARPNLGLAETWLIYIWWHCFWSKKGCSYFYELINLSVKHINLWESATKSLALFCNVHMPLLNTIVSQMLIENLISDFPNDQENINHPSNVVYLHSALYIFIEIFHHPH